MTEPKSPREYTNAEAASIITRVLDRANGENGRISYDELLETAREIGVTTAELDQAVVEETKRRAEQLVREEERQRAVRQLARFGAGFVVAGAFAFVIDTKLTGGVWYYWFLLSGMPVLAFLAQRALVLPPKPAAPDKRVELRDGKLIINNPPSDPGKR
jgi:hypothetical protein